MLSAAATLVLIIAGAHGYDLTPRLASQSGAPFVAPSPDVRSSKEMDSSVPPLTDAARPHRGKEPLSTGFVVPSRAPAPRPTVDRGDDPPRAAVDSDTRVGIVPISPITLPAVSASAVELGAVPPKLAPELAEELQLSDTQRKKIEAIYDMRQHALDEILDSTRKRVELERDQTLAAVERVLTPNQRKQYRERCASQESSFATRQAVPLPPAHRPVPQQTGSAVCRE